MDDHEPIAGASLCNAADLDWRYVRLSRPGLRRDAARAAHGGLATVGVRMSASRHSCPGSGSLSAPLVLRPPWRRKDNAAAAFWATLLA